MDSTRKLADERSDDAQEEDPAQKTDPRLFGEILPPEIWERIADKVLENNSEDYSNLVNSSRYFQDLRASQRTTALFEQVLPLVATSVWKKDGMKGFPVKDVLNCRLVCKQWNAAIQRVVPDKFANSGKSFIGEGADSQEFVKIGRRFDAIQKNCWFGDEWEEDGRKINEDKYSVYKFLAHFRQSHGPTYRSKGRNPFFCRKIELQWNREMWPTVPADYQPYLQAINEMLSTYGTQVAAFAVNSDEIAFLEEALPLIPKWLSLLPNLNKFEFMDEDRNTYRNINLDDEQPLPKLEHLEQIWISSGPLAMFNQLIRENSHVSELWLDNPTGYQELFTFPLPNLKKLTLLECQPGIIKQFSSPQVQWPLETLELDGVKFVGGYDRLFQVIQVKFAETLECLKLVVDPWCGVDDFDVFLWRDCHNLRLDLPKLKKIKLNFGSRRVCLDFLLPMRNNLEEIAVSWGRIRADKHASQCATIQYEGLRKKMLRSNVWTIFKKLTKFEVLGVKIYWRKEWNEWMLKNEQ